VAGGLHLWRDNGEFLTNQRIHQCRLPNIGLTYNTYKTRLMLHVKQLSRKETTLIS
jgi:hypothetical protein